LSLIAAHINDAGISVLDNDRILYREPGYALIDEQGLVTGDAAFAQSRLHPRRIQNTYWSALSAEPLPDRRFRHLSAADLVSSQLEEIWQKVSGAGDRVVVAVPAWMSTDALALLLGIAAELGIPVAGLVDAAVAATRREYRGAVPVHVDLGLHHAALTRLGQSGQAQAEKSSVVESSGLLALRDAWIRMIADAFVRQSRFDPLHTAETEQVLNDRLDDWLVAAAASDKVLLEVEFRGITHNAEIESLQLVAAAAPVYQRIVAQLRALYRAEESPALQLTERAARMPGLADTLKARVGGEVFLLESGATARGLLARCRDMQSAPDRVSLVRQLPWDRSPVKVSVAQDDSGTGTPTHLLLGNRAFRIDDRPLSLGSQATEGGRCIDLGGDMPGVSRRHCSVTRRNGQCVVEDYSRYGTFLNGHPIDGSAVLQVGDLLRLGSPGYEMRLITTEESDGA